MAYRLGFLLLVLSGPVFTGSPARAEDRVVVSSPTVPSRAARPRRGPTAFVQGVALRILSNREVLRGFSAIGGDRKRLRSYALSVFALLGGLIAGNVLLGLRGPARGKGWILAPLMLVIFALGNGVLFFHYFGTELRSIARSLRRGGKAAVPAPARGGLSDGGERPGGTRLPAGIDSAER